MSSFYNDENLSLGIPANSSAPWHDLDVKLLEQSQQLMFWPSVVPFPVHTTEQGVMSGFQVINKVVWLEELVKCFSYGHDTDAQSGGTMICSNSRITFASLPIRLLICL